MRPISANGRTRRVLVTGLPLFARRIGDLLAGDGWRTTVITPQAVQQGALRNIEKARLFSNLAFSHVLYQIGGPCVNDRIVRTCANLGRPIILHWVGSDVSEVVANPTLRSNVTSEVITHWCDSVWLQAELNQVGISATVMPSSAVVTSGELPLPAGPLTVLLYLPEKRWDFYSGDALTSLAQEFPSVRFLVVGSNGKGHAGEPNLTYLGWVTDMTPIYARSHVLIRMPLHDGLSAMVVEALSQGRQVIWQHSLPGVLRAVTMDEARAHLTHLEDSVNKGSLRLNTVGMNHTRAEYHRSAVAKKLRKGLGDVLQGRPIGSPTLSPL